MTSRAQSTLLTTGWRLPSPSRRTMCDCGGTRSCTQRAPERVARGEHPVADGEQGAAFEQLAGEPGHLAGRAFAEAVVQLHRLAVHGADPQQVEALFAARSEAAGAFGERRREADALEPIEIDVLKHLESEARGRPRRRADADRRQTHCRNERCMRRRWRRRIRTTSVEPAFVAGTELRADQAAADTAAGAESGMVLDMRLSFAGRWKGEARGASGWRPTGCRRGPESPRSIGRRQRTRTPESRFAPQWRRGRPCSRAGRPHIGNKVIRPSYDRRALVHLSRLILEKE